MIRRSSFLPTKDSLLLGWSANFVARITAWREELGLTSTNVTDYTELHNGFATTYSTASEPMTRTRAAVAEKNDCRRRLKEMAALLAKIIEGQSNVTDAQRIDLGLTVRKPPAPIPAPEMPPGIDIVSTRGYTVKGHLHDLTGPSMRRRPAGTDGAMIFTYIGTTPPSDTKGWTYEGSTSRLDFTIEVPSTTPSGSTVWVTAAWVGTRMQMGPAAAPICFNIAGGLLQAV